MEPQSGDTPQGPAQPAPPLSENTKRPAAATPEKLVTPAARLSRRQSAEKGPPAVYEGSGSQRRRESRFRGTNQLIVPESVNADADPYRFLPKPAPRAAKAAVAAPRADDDAAEEPRGRLSFGAAAPPAPVSEPPTAPAPAPAGRPSTGAFSDLGEDAAARRQRRRPRFSEAQAPARFLRSGVVRARRRDGRFRRPRRRLRQESIRVSIRIHRFRNY